MPRYKQSQCMKCNRPPEVDVLWAEGMGRAWFCEKCYKTWKKEHPGEVCAEHKVKDGMVPARWNKKTKDHKGIMVALPVPPQTAKTLSLLQGMFHSDDFIKPEDMHVTLLYLEAKEIEPEALAMALERFMSTRIPLVGKVSGTGQFGHGAYYASVDVPTLSAFRQDLAKTLGIMPNSEHGFVPHITLAYTDPKVNVPVDLLVEFDQLLLAWGDTRILYPFAGGR